MTRDDLKARKRKELATMARSRRIAGWHAMRKDELIEALLKSASTLKRRPRQSKKRVATSNGHAQSDPKTARPARTTANRLSAHHSASNPNAAKDILTVNAHDSNWIEVHWTLSREILERAEAALGADWYQAVPVIRVFDVTVEDNETSRNAWVEDVEIKSGIDHWFVPVKHPSQTYQLRLGYRSAGGRFFSMVRSAQIQTNKQGCMRATQRNGKQGTNGNGSHRQGRLAQTGPFDFQIRTELCVHGTTHPDAKVTLLGEPIAIEHDGTFSARIELPQPRQVIPVVAISPNGAEKRTIVVGLECHTKTLEPQKLEESPF